MHRDFLQIVCLLLLALSFAGLERQRALGLSFLSAEPASASKPLPRCKRYASLSLGITQDLKNGLHWMRCTAGEKATLGLCKGQAKALDWYAARDFCKRLRLGGYRWRLPSLRELQSLIYLGKDRPPFIQSDYFSLSTRSEYWSKDSHTDEKGLLFDYLNFEDAGRYSAPPRTRLFVRCVALQKTKAKRPKISGLSGCALR